MSCAIIIGETGAGLVQPIPRAEVTFCACVDDASQSADIAQKNGGGQPIAVVESCNHF